MPGNLQPQGPPARLETVLRLPEYSEFIEELQQRIETRPHYLDEEREEAYARALAVLAMTGYLRNTPLTREEGDRALRSVVRPTDR